MSEPSLENTDRELWREREGDYYANSIHVTAWGGIGINVGGTVYVMPLEAWHQLAGGKFQVAQPEPAAHPELPGAVAIPKSADEAELMVRLGSMWLTTHAPERLEHRPGFIAGYSAALAARQVEPTSPPAQADAADAMHHGTYRHYKGGLYDVLAFPDLEADGTPMVVYQSQDTMRVWTRPLAEWRQKFTYVSTPPAQESGDSIE